MLIAFGLKQSFLLQDGTWPWLATDLPKLRTLLLTRAHAGTALLWPAAIGDCTALRSLYLEGSTAAPIPDGPYLSRLEKLAWLAPFAEIPDALADAAALEELAIGSSQMRLERVAGCSILPALLNLRKLSLPVLAQKIPAATAALSLQQHLPGVAIDCQRPIPDDWC